MSTYRTTVLIANNLASNLAIFCFFVFVKKPQNTRIVSTMSATSKKRSLLALSPNSPDYCKPTHGHVSCGEGKGGRPMKDTQTITLLLVGLGIASVLAYILLKPKMTMTSAPSIAGYTNNETWEINRDGTGRINSVTIHRKAATT
jgi:hypothetical protein